MSGKTARMSALPVLQFCGQAQRLGESLGAGRAAAIGTAFHAKCSEHPQLVEIMARLTDDEREDVDSLIKPTDVEVSGFALTYDMAEKEIPVGITPDGKHCEYDDENALLRGTVDFDWLVHDTVSNRKTVYVADIKRTAYAAPDGCYSLQVIGYAIALADKHGADGYVTGIWDATEGAWEWSEYVDMWSERAETNWQRVRASALNHGGEYSVGSHCTGCYGRKRCPQWLLPLDLAATSLEPFTREGGLTNETACQALLMSKRVEDTIKAVKEIAENFARDNNGIIDEERGKVWAPINVKGRTSFNSKQLEKDNPELAQQYISTGKPFQQFRWLNRKDK